MQQPAPNLAIVVIRWMFSSWLAFLSFFFLFVFSYYDSERNIILCTRHAATNFQQYNSRLCLGYSYFGRFTWCCTLRAHMKIKIIFNFFPLLWLFLASLLVFLAKRLLRCWWSFFPFRFALFPFNLFDWLVGFFIFFVIKHYLLVSMRIASQIFHHFYTRFLFLLCIFWALCVWGNVQCFQDTIMNGKTWLRTSVLLCLQLSTTPDRLVINLQHSNSWKNCIFERMPEQFGYISFSFNTKCQ